MSRRVNDRSLKDEMRAAVRGDRERAEARRKAEEDGAHAGPAPPVLDLNRPTREWKLPAKAEEQEPEPEIAPEPEGVAEPGVPKGFIARMKALFDNS